nr:MAG TPA: hypothetical protein [Caudoviricetes sp.]
MCFSTTNGCACAINSSYPSSIRDLSCFTALNM